MTRLTYRGPPRGGAIPASYFGMHVQYAAGYAPWSVSAVPIHAETGYGAVRLYDSICTWKYIEGTQGVRDWSHLDAVVAAWGTSYGRLILTLGNPPDWATGQSTSAGSQYSPYKPTSTTDWTNFLSAVLARYPGKFHYEIWNEPNQNTASAGFSGTVADLVALAAAAYPIIKAADPSALVLTPCITTFTSGLTYLDQYLRAGGGAYADIISIHGYVDPDPPEAIVSLVQTARAIADRQGLSAKPIWVSEFGYIQYYDLSGVKHTDNTTLMSDVQAAAYVARSMIAAWLGGAQRAYWYALDAAWVMSIPFLDYPGNTTTLKPAGKAYAALAGMVSGGTLSDFRQPGGYFRVSFQGAKGSGVAYWCADGKTATISIPGALRAYDVLGAAVDVSGGTLSATYSPVYVVFA